MNDNEQKRDEYAARVRRNEEYIAAIRGEIDRLEEQEYDTEQRNWELLRITWESDGWRGEEAQRSNARMEEELQNLFESGRRILNSRYDERRETMASLHRENEILGEELEKLDRED